MNVGRFRPEEGERLEPRPETLGERNGTVCGRCTEQEGKGALR